MGRVKANGGDDAKDLGGVNCDGEDVDVKAGGETPPLHINVVAPPNAKFNLQGRPSAVRKKGNIISKNRFGIAFFSSAY